MRHPLSLLLVLLALSLAGCATQTPEREESITEIVAALKAFHGEDSE